MRVDAVMCRPQPLSVEAFAPYGCALLIAADEVGTAINGGSSQRFDARVPLDVLKQGGQPAVSVYRTAGVPVDQPCALTLLERHNLGSQTFVPLGQARVLMVVAPTLAAEEAPDVDRMQAFWLEPGQGATLAAGTWHHPMIAVGPAQVLVIERRAPQVDCELYPLPAGLWVLA